MWNGDGFKRRNLNQEIEYLIDLLIDVVWKIRDSSNGNLTGFINFTFRRNINSSTSIHELTVNLKDSTPTLLFI